MVTICGSVGPTCESVITVGLHLARVRVRDRVRNLGLGLVLGLALWLRLGLLIVVYKLLEK